jgi:pyruvate dehydrogenase E1 component alpha subunit
VAVGVIDVLRPDDVVSGTYRGHAAYLAKHGDLNAMMAELFGKQTGCARGKGGSMHLIDMDQFILGTSAVVATHIPIACGYALALTREGRGRIAAVFFGDGATEEGVFYESLNFAALHQLPMLFICENNGYAIHTPLSKRWATERLTERVSTYGISAEVVPDGDIFRIRELTSAAVERARVGNGPSFIECHTYRWLEHVGPNEDYHAGYRNESELKLWTERDSMRRLAALLDDRTRAGIDEEIEADIVAAIAFASASPFPDPEELMRHVYA